MARQELFPQSIREQLSPLYSQEQEPEPLVICKFFTPDSNWTLYATEGSPVDADGYYDTDKEKIDFLFFGLIVGFETELGYFSLNEMAAARGPLGMAIERDTHFTPAKLSVVRKLHR